MIWINFVEIVTSDTHKKLSEQFFIDNNYKKDNKNRKLLKKSKIF